MGGDYETCKLDFSTTEEILRTEEGEREGLMHS